MNDIEAMTNMIRNGMDPAHEREVAESYLEGVIHVLQCIDPGDLHAVLGNLSLGSIDEIKERA